MDELKKTSSFVLYGIKDCLLGMMALRKFWSQSPNPKQQRDRRPSAETPKTLRNILCDCLVFGVLFCGPISFFFRIVVDKLIAYVMESYLEPEERDTINTYFISSFSVLFNVTWTIPLFLISRIQNYSWYQQIADIMFVSTGGKKKTVAFSYGWSDQIESFVVQCLFLIQGYAMLFFPYLPEFIKHALLMLHLSLLYSLYSFEYKWIQLGWGLRKRLAYINTRWPYYLGFGLPLAVISSYFGTYTESICIFSTLFPIYVVSSTVTMDKRVEQCSFPIKFFSPAYYITNLIFVFLLTRISAGRR